MKNSVKSIIFSALLYTVYYWGVALLASLITVVPNFIVCLITTDINTRSLTVFVSMIIITIVGLFILFYKDGYKKNVSYDKNNIFINLSIALICSYVIYYLTGLLTKFSFHLNNSSTLASIIMRAEIENLYEEHLGILNIMFLILLIPMSASSILGFRIGSAKRKKDRANIQHNT